MQRILLIIAALWSHFLLNASAFAADHPSSRIEKYLHEARRTINLDLSDLEPGEVRSVDYASDRVWIYRRTEADLEYLRAAQHEHLANPGSAGFREVIEDQYSSSTSELWARLLLVTQPQMEKTPFRSANENFLVIRPSGPLGCTLNKMPPDLRPIPAAPFMDVCTGSWFDVAGRMLKGDWTPPPGRAAALAGANLTIPPHHYTGPARLVVGLAPADTLPEIDRAALRARVYARLNAQDRLAAAARFNDIEEVRRGLRDGVPAQPALNRWPCPPDPLDAAIIGGSMEVIQLLLERGARPTKNAFEILAIIPRPAVESLLKKYEVKATSCVLPLSVTID